MTVVHPCSADWLRPFYDPANFTPVALFHGTSVAVLTYIGFDGISTMAEEVENPRRNILLATVLTCLVIGVLSAVGGVCRADGLAGPSADSPAIVDTAFVHVGARVGGNFLFQLLNATLLVANMGSGNRGAIWRGAPDLRHGQRPLASSANFRRFDPVSCSAQQRSHSRRYCIDRSPRDDATSRERNCSTSARLSPSSE